MIWFIFLRTVYKGAWLFPHTHYTGNSLVIYCCVTNDRMLNSLEHVLSLFLWVGSLKGDWQSDIIMVAQKAGRGVGTVISRLRQSGGINRQNVSHRRPVAESLSLLPSWHPEDSAVSSPERRQAGISSVFQDLVSEVTAILSETFRKASH